MPLKKKNNKAIIIAMIFEIAGAFGRGERYLTILRHYLIHSYFTNYSRELVWSDVYDSSLLGLDLGWPLPPLSRLGQ